MTDLFSVVEGDSDAPAVMLHTSLACSHRMWDPQVPALVAAGWRVLRYDFRGHGASAPVGVDGIDGCTLADFGGDALALLAQHGVAAAVHVGLSLGGMVAMWLAEHAPEAVDGLVLCCTSAALGPSQAWLDRGALVRAQGTAAVADVMPARWLTPDYAAGHPNAVARIRDEILATSAGGYAAGCHAIATMDLLAGLPSIGVPTLVIAGAQDPGTPVEHGRLIADQVAGARMAVVDPGAHLLNVERPNAIGGLIVEYLGALRHGADAAAN